MLIGSSGAFRGIPTERQLAQFRQHHGVDDEFRRRIQRQSGRQEHSLGEGDRASRTQAAHRNSRG